MSDFLPERGSLLERRLPLFPDSTPLSKVVLRLPDALWKNLPGNMARRFTLYDRLTLDAAVDAYRNRPE